MDNKEIGRIIKRLVRILGSKEAVASQVGASVYALARWEKGKNVPHKMFLKKLIELHQEITSRVAEKLSK